MRHSNDANTARTNEHAHDRANTEQQTRITWQPNQADQADQADQPHYGAHSCTYSVATAPQMPIRNKQR